MVLIINDIAEACAAEGLSRSVNPSCNKRLLFKQIEGVRFSHFTV